MTITAVICGAKDWSQIVIASQGMVAWLSGYVDMSGGMSCEGTLRDLLLRSATCRRTPNAFGTFFNV